MRPLPQSLPALLNYFDECKGDPYILTEADKMPIGKKWKNEPLVGLGIISKRLILQIWSYGIYPKACSPSLICLASTTKSTRYLARLKDMLLFANFV